MSGENDLSFACRCGAVTGHIENASPDIGDHLVCHCTDCQRFAKLCGAEERVLDQHAGTALFQSRCAAVKIDKGKEELACLHLTEMPTLRWYARCCETPMFNTYKNGRLPYVSTILGNTPVQARRALIGAPVGQLHVDEGRGSVGDVPRMSMPALIFHAAKRIAKDTLTGKRRQAALFDAETLLPIAEPERISPERQRL